ncbi:hypothetical protein P9D34_00645 [Bacillus swezeyi]|uniref:Uncharacterized protein n=1 Tax=Bacillus swezeyi TaxID=1925020 RepID=A0A1R1QR14_9BACI|nr:hypothetical protein [Bacillus swezeyi]MEC1258966.1 hypothetical protein [Bacillus swezeyi]MED2928073.1 hypothetical protein [Bacillus swezeyi]MED2965015.1 hypothetical protein [Bacillus swezeyi]MED3071276.1 hypothetical protein [Bacillus swezeyi]MED3081086.1 hypothetical protein [Bacillus swezeyi]
MNKRITSFAAIVLSLTLFLAFTMPTVSNAFSSKNGAVSVEKEKYISVLEALENSIVKKGSNYIVDTKVAKDYGLTDTEINNLKEFLEDSSNQQIEQTLNEVPEAKKQAE